MKKWRIAPLSEDFWVSVIMTVTGCPLPFPSETREELREPKVLVTVGVEQTREDAQEKSERKYVDVI